jgi:hypothetical protein
LDPDGMVMASGGIEIMLGGGLAVLNRDRVLVGRLLAAFFVAVFPGNVAQFIHERDGFGLDTDTRRFVRLLFQPVLVAWALWSTAVPRRSHCYILDRLELRGADDGSEMVLRLAGIADPPRVDLVDQTPDEAVVHGGDEDDAVGDRADVTRVEERAERRCPALPGRW